MKEYCLNFSCSEDIIYFLSENPRINSLAIKVIAIYDENGIPESWNLYYHF